MSSLQNSFFKKPGNVLTKSIQNTSSQNVIRKGSVLELKKDSLDNKVKNADLFKVIRRSSRLPILEKIYLPLPKKKIDYKKRHSCFNQSDCKVSGASLKLLSEGKNNEAKKRASLVNIPEDLKKKSLSDLSKKNFSLLRSSTSTFSCVVDKENRNQESIEQVKSNNGPLDFSCSKIQAAYRREKRRQTILPQQPLENRKILELMSREENIKAFEITAIFSRIKQMTKEGFQRLPSPVSANLSFEKINSTYPSVPMNDSECFQILRIHNYEWEKIREHYQNDFPTMISMSQYRDRVIRQILNSVDMRLREKSDSRAALVIFEAHGNKDPFSDLDITVVATTRKRHYEALALILTHKIFKKNGWPKTLSSVFDTQLYASYFPITPDKETFLDALHSTSLLPSKMEMKKLSFWTSKRNTFYTKAGKDSFHVLQLRGAFIQLSNLVPTLWRRFKSEVLKKSSRMNPCIDPIILQEAEDLILQAENELSNRIIKTYQRDNKIFQKMINDARKSFKMDPQQDSLLGSFSQEDLPLNLGKVQRKLKKQMSQKIVAVYPDYKLEAKDDLYDQKMLSQKLSLEHLWLLKKHEKLMSGNLSRQEALEVLHDVEFPKYQGKSLKNLESLIDKKHLKLIEKNINAHIHATEGYLLEGSIKHVVYELQSQNAKIPPLSAMDYLESFLEQVIFFLYKSKKTDAKEANIIHISKYAFRAIDAIQKAIRSMEKLNVDMRPLKKILKCKKIIQTFFAMRNFQTTSFLKEAISTLGFSHLEYRELSREQRSEVVRYILSHSSIKGFEELENLFYCSLLDVSAWYFCNCQRSILEFV